MLHPGDRRDRRDRLQSLLETLGDSICPGRDLAERFPGWAASAATSLTFLFGFSDTTVPWIVTILLLSIGLAITVSPVVYNTISDR